MTHIILFILLLNNTSFSSDLSHVTDSLLTIDTLNNHTWENFFSENYFTKLYLVFAGPYPASPTSSFGHIFILFEPKNDRPIFLWQTLDFSANIDSVGSFEFFLKGIFGGLVGEYRIVPFFEKYREYTFIESRPLWLFPFRLSEREKVRLLYNIYKLQKNSYSYSFTNKNCASQIDSLLVSSLDNTTVSDRAIFFPNTLINHWLNRIDDPIYIESMQNLLEEGILEVPENILDLNYDISKLTDSEKGLLLNILEWKYEHENVYLTSKQERLLKELRINLSKSKNNSYVNFNNTSKEFNLHPTTLVSFGIKHRSDNIQEFLLSYRFGIHEFYENTTVYPANDYLAILKMEIGIRKNKIALNEVWLFNQLSLQPISPLATLMSWRIGIGMERENEYINSPTVTGLFTGLGLSTTPFNKNINLSLLMNISPVYMQGYGLTILYGPEFITQVNIFNTIKIMNRFKYVFASNKQIQNVFSNETNIGIELTNASNLYLQFNYYGDSYFVIKYNFYIN